MSSADILQRLVGVPYVERGRTLDGLDCWGLCLLAARALFGLEFPEHYYAERELLASAQTLIAHETAEPYWQRAAAPFAPGVVHIFRIRGAEVHCALHLCGQDFLHTLPGRDSCIERLDAGNWRERRTGSWQWTP